MAFNKTDRKIIIFNIYIYFFRTVVFQLFGSGNTVGWEALISSMSFFPKQYREVVYLHIQLCVKEHNIQPTQMNFICAVSTAIRWGTKLYRGLQSEGHRINALCHPVLSRIFFYMFHCKILFIGTLIMYALSIQNILYCS